MCRGQTIRNQEKKYREGEAICLPLTTIIKTAFIDTRLTEDEISTFGCMGIGLGLVLLFHSSTTASSTLPPSIFLKKRRQNNTKIDTFSLVAKTRQKKCNHSRMPLCSFVPGTLSVFSTAFFLQIQSSERNENIIASPKGKKRKTNRNNRT
jgi:hypothetical protein